MKNSTIKLKFIIYGCIALILFIVSVLSLAVFNRRMALLFITLQSLFLFLMILQVLSPAAREEFYQDQELYPQHVGVFSDTLVDNLNKKVIDRDAQIERLKLTIANQQIELDKYRHDNNSSNQEVS